MSIESLNLKEVVKVSKKISINNLLSILDYHGVGINHIEFIPVFKDSSNTATILGIFKKKDKIVIKINLFKIKLFSRWENIYISILEDDYFLPIKDDIKELLHIYFFNSKSLFFLKKNNYYNRLPANITISNIINSLSNFLSDKVLNVISYDKYKNIIQKKPSYLGVSHIDNIYLGELAEIDSYIVNITIFSLSIDILNNSITRIKNEISSSIKAIKNHNLGKIKIITKFSVIDNSKESLSYIEEVYVGENFHYFIEDLISYSNESIPSTLY